MGLRQDLGPGPAALDTVVFIYYIEENERFLPLVAPVTTLLAAVLWPPAGLVGLIVGGAASVATLVLLSRAGH